MEKDESRLEKFKELLNTFNELPPKPVYEPTYLELCSYPRHRFEEICSRLLRFFMDKNGPHGVGSLFIDSLIEIYRSKFESDAIFGKSNTLIAETEVKTTNDNRIDLVITSDDFVICVENKIWAQRDNPFDDYFNYIESIKGDRNAFYIILSMGGSEDPEGSKKQFKVIFYSEFIEKIKEKIGMYLINCNRKYLSVLTDWFQYLENKGGLMSNFSEEERDFFQKNDDKISKLIARRSEFLNEKRMEQCNRIANIKKLLDPDESLGWWVYKEIDLGYHFEKGNKNYEIGVEAEFASLIEDKINIEISIWELENQKERIKLYSRELKDAFGDLNGYYTKGKWIAVVKKIDAYDDDKIVKEKILEVRNKLENIVKKIKNSKK